MVERGRREPMIEVVNSTEGQSQVDTAYQLIKRDILTCVIEPSSRMTETELVERYGLGRAAVRTALNRLYQEAFVDVLPRYGYVVASHSIADAKDLFQVQLILEPAAAQLAAGRVDSKQLLELDEMCKRTQDVHSSVDAAAFLHANTNFHAAVASATGNPLIARFIRILFERLERFLYASGSFEEVVREVGHSHGQVMELLITGQGAEAAHAIHEQTRHNHEKILNVLAKRGLVHD